MDPLDRLIGEMQAQESGAFRPLRLYKTKGFFKQLFGGEDTWKTKRGIPYTGEVTTLNGCEKGSLLEGLRHGEWLLDCRKQKGYHNAHINIVWRTVGKDGYGLINYKLGKMEGLQTFYYSNGKKFQENTMVNGKPHGSYLKFNPNGDVCDKTLWEMGESIPLEIKTETTYHENGDKKCTTTWHDNGNKRSDIPEDGNGTERNWDYAGTLRFECEKKDGKMHGTATNYWNDGNKTNEQQWLNGQQHGKKITWDLWEGTKKEINYEFGKKNGLEFWWSRTGIERRREYKDDDLVKGSEIYRTKDGQTYSSWEEAYAAVSDSNS